MCRVTACRAARWVELCPGAFGRAFSGWASSQTYLPGRVFWVRLPGIQKIPGSEEPGIGGAPEGIRTPNLLIRSQMLYPLSYRRMFLASDFFNPSRQQVILYGGYEGPASRKTQKGPIFGSPECCNASFYREIPGFLVPGKFFKIFLCCSEQEVGSLRGDSPSRAILTLRPSNFSLITLGVFLLKV